VTPTKWAFFVVIALAWMPYGLIHQGQRLINAKAAPIIPLLQRCDPADPGWKGCR
jgi:hypothetical protein